MATAEELATKFDKMLNDMDKQIQHFKDDIDSSIDFYNKRRLSCNSRREVGECLTQISKLESLKHSVSDLKAREIMWNGTIQRLCKNQR